MNETYDHDRYVAKNRAIAAAEELERRDKKPEKKGVPPGERKDASCFNCKMKSHCTEFKARRSGRASGVVSVGGDEKFVCKRYTPAQAQSKTMSDKQIKSLLKNAKKGLR